MKTHEHAWFAGLLCAALLVFAPFSAFAAEQTHTNSLGMEFVLIPAGSFTMGADMNHEDANGNETPPRRVSLTRPFYLGRYAVTQAQWEAVMGSNPSKFKGPDNPVEQVSWDDAQEFIRLLNEREGHKRYRLPTEAEWEYAARAGSRSAYCFGYNDVRLGDYAWYEDNSGETTHPVGLKTPNAWGLYDMHGNVYEWTRDWFDRQYYRKKPPSTDPGGPDAGTRRVKRGGSWLSGPRSCRSAYRYYDRPEARGSNTGFRLAITPE